VDTERKEQVFRRGVDLFNERKFFACHEALEEIWLEETPAEKPFYQGLIQVAAGFHQLLEKKNPRGAASLIRRGVKKLERCPPAYGGLDLAGLRAALTPWLDALARGQPTAALAPPTLNPPQSAL